MLIDFSPNTRDVSAAFTEVVDAGMVAANATREKRNYLGGSRLGEECSRKLFYEFTHTPMEKPFDGQTLRRFARGHDAEARMSTYIRGAGFDLATEKADGGQFGFYVARDREGVARIAGHLDGILRSGPILLHGQGFPGLWEHKGLYDSGVGDLRRVGLARAYPVYYAQVQTYMAYMDLTTSPCLFTAENQNDCTLYAELVPFDLQAAQAASDRGARVVSANDARELPRISRDPQDWRCNMCSYQERCWSVQDTPAAAPMVRPAWLTNAG